ncbi:hypothetical protein C5167_024876 [Papaver somniferum]|uniref:Uncharacterized protein n=1 Tax=Papaver somniferum TaxID=3469 RepID=A0A4Y7JRF0_PAPSO|nr:hypothetical protein C5167_024876 [Papaver somniferum]
MNKSGFLWSIVIILMEWFSGISNSRSNHNVRKTRNELEKFLSFKISKTTAITNNQFRKRSFRRRRTETSSSAAAETREASNKLMLKEIRKAQEEEGKLGRGENNNNNKSARPYLSEAWAVLDNKRKEEELLLINWQVPKLNSEIEMKFHLRNWAHTVASAVR